MDRDQARHVVIGAGPLGLAVVRELRRRGQPVRLVTRTGRAEAPSGAEVIAADVSDPAQARPVLGDRGGERRRTPDDA